MSEATEKGKKILDNELPVPAGKELRILVGELKGELEFGVARKVLSKVREQDSQNQWIVQQLALCTYKDEELLPATRFADALELLEQIGLRDPRTTDPETLALGGGVYKRMWEQDGQLEHLHRALAFYHAAWRRNRAQDMGYGGVNAAYVLDVLASRVRIIAVHSGTEPEEAKRLRQRAMELRQEMAPHLSQAAAATPDLLEQYWYVVTMAEVSFGLGQYPEAEQWLARARGLNAKEWERQTTFRQLVSLARLQGLDLPREGSETATWHPAWKALHAFLGEDTEPALSCYRGKVGLTLSGGGFRASLFHLGVLARLAEMDVLRSVEFLSTVSGGSIVGAHYYLEVQNLLQTKKDRDVRREDFILIVRRVQEQFLAGVQRNLRTRALADLRDNLKMIFSKEYSRSHRLGELYEQELYSRVGDGHPQNEPRTVPQLLIAPAGQSAGDQFKPKFSNWRRRAKVPVLLLNATSLNSGHGWHFTARWMGEPPGLIGTEVDVNERYRRLWYEQAPTRELQDYRLGYAVAASACVPGLFEPLALEGLYPGRTIRLVDGGVHDNQGVEGLLNEGCTFILCSDASGQMEDLKRPSDSVLGVPLRSNGILMDRVREAEYQDLRGRVDSRSLEGLFFIHLKKGLETSPLDWTNCQDPTVPPPQSVSTTAYGVDKDLQRKLAAIRTDLDSFSEVEAHSLMLSGYLLTEHEFKELDRKHRQDGHPGSWGSFAIHAPRGDWPFLQLEPLVRQPPDSSDARREELGKQLAASASLAFKIWKLSRALRATAWTAGAAALFLLGWVLHGLWDTRITLPSVSVKGLAVFVILTLAAILVPTLKWLRPEEAMRGYVGKAVVAVGGFMFSNLHLWIFDPMFLRRGRLKRLLELR